MTTWVMESGVISEMNQKQVMEEAEEKLAVQKRGKRKGEEKKNLWKGRSEEIFCTGLVSIRKEKGDDTLPAGEWRFS